VTLIMPSHFVTGLLITLSLSFSELSHFMLFFPMNYLCYDKLVRFAHSEYMKKSCSCSVPIRLNRSLKVKLLEFILTAGRLLGC